MNVLKTAFAAKMANKNTESAKIAAAVLAEKQACEQKLLALDYQLKLAELNAKTLQGKRTIAIESVTASLTNPLEAANVDQYLVNVKQFNKLKEADEVATKEENENIETITAEVEAVKAYMAVVFAEVE